MVAGLVLDVEAERGAVAGEFDADDRFDAGLDGGLGEFDGAMKIAGVGQGQGREVTAFGQVDDSRDGEGGVEEGVVAVKAER